LVLILSAASSRETKLIVDLQEHGSTAPRYTENPEYKTTNNNYEEFPGELTDQGILQMENIGKQLRNDYIESNKFLPNEFKPQNFYLKSYRDEPSALSSYASILGAYPQSVNWIQYQHMGGFSEAPFSRDDEMDIRKTIGLGDNPSQLSTREVTIWSETNGRTLFNDPANNCPQMQRQMAQNMDLANTKYTKNKRFDALYEQMSETLGITQKNLEFKNAHLYLDDYITSKANGKPVPQFEEQIVADQWIQNYYRKYYYEGLYGDNLDLSRVASNHYFTYVLTSMYAKHKIAKGELKNDHFDNLKYAQFTGNENSMIAAIKLLNEKSADPVVPPQFGSTLRFELFENGGGYFVKGTLDGKVINMEGDKDGIIPYEGFMNLIYKKLYFGDVDLYCTGAESMVGKDKPKLSSYEEYIWSVNPELRINYKLAETKENNFVEQSFVEVKQKAPEPVERVVEVIEEPKYLRAQPIPYYHKNSHQTYYSEPQVSRQVQRPQQQTQVVRGKNYEF